MLLSYLQGCWRNGHQSHVFELRRSGHQSADTFQFVKSLSILENTGRAGTGLWRWKDLSRLGYCQSNCVNCWHCKCTIMCLFQDVEVQSKVRTNTVHYIWNTNNWTVKIFPVQLKFWNGPLFPTYMYVSTQNQKVICRYCENKNNKVSGPVCCLIPRADTIHFAWSN